jgi:hypothetical protein
MLRLFMIMTGLMIISCQDTPPTKNDKCNPDESLVEVFFSKERPFRYAKEYRSRAMFTTGIYEANLEMDGEWDWPATQVFVDAFSCNESICDITTAFDFAYSGDTVRIYSGSLDYTTYRVCEVTEDYMRLYGDDEDDDLEFFGDSTLTLMAEDSVVWAPPVQE